MLPSLPSGTKVPCTLSRVRCPGKHPVNSAGSQTPWACGAKLAALLAPNRSLPRSAANPWYQTNYFRAGALPIHCMIGNSTDSVASIADDRATFYFSLHFSIQTLARSP